jgi:hypothetical protein
LADVLEPLHHLRTLLLSLSLTKKFEVNPKRAEQINTAMEEFAKDPRAKEEILDSIIKCKKKRTKYRKIR